MSIPGGLPNSEDEADRGTVYGKKSVNFAFEYVTSAVSALQDDGIVVHVVNDNSALSKTQMVIYQNTGAGAVTAVDSGPVDVTATWNWGLCYTILQSGEYWLRVRVTTEFLVPKAVDSGIWTPIVTYRKGDFAIFKLQPARKRIW